jgi:hypothetical protein
MMNDRLLRLSLARARAAPCRLASSALPSLRRLNRQNPKPLPTSSSSPLEFCFEPHLHSQFPMVYVLVSPARTSPSSGSPPPPAVDDRSPEDLLPQLPPPPTLGSSWRPERLADRLKGGAGDSGTGRRPPAVADRSPEDLPPLPPPMGLSRPERLGDGAGPSERKTSASPGEGGGRGRRRGGRRRPNRSSGRVAGG